ncbi:MAG TPA: AAA family ATPase [Thermoanaerobaculia bacterium]|nr:AAA family ATPase [Thermoanaerobaculia bacterium]
MRPVALPVCLDDPALCFPSLASLRAAHGELLKLQREAGDTSEFQERVETLIRRGRATGALLDGTEDRWAAQGILDYWSTALFRVACQTVDTTLEQFDPGLAPELPEESCPYVGLDAFQESTFGVFFGRERLVKAMLQRLADERLLAVTGDSGSGKSSLVLAGLLSRLKAGALPGSETWRYPSPLVPGSEPLMNLARVLLQPGSAGETAAHAARLLANPDHLVEMVADDQSSRPCVLVVDQFEEVFSLCDAVDARQAFADGLAALVKVPAPRHTVILTLRSDYESQVAKLETFMSAFEGAQVRVTPLSAPELRAAIEEPASLAGLKFEEGVVDALLRDILGEPAGLPLLQFTLLKLWQSRERNRVTWESYRRLSGGRLALRRSADAFYDSLIPEEQVTARRILLRMVRPSEDRLEVTSSRIRREALFRGEASDRVARVLDKLIAARLVRLTEGETPADAQVEVAHEALVRNWPRLVDWLEQERSEINTRRRLETLMEEWLRLDRKGGLLDEVQIADAERWLASSSAALLGYRPELPALVATSREAMEERRRQKEAVHHRELEQAQFLAETERRRAEEKARSTRIFRGLATALLVLFVSTAVIGWRAYSAKQEAQNLQMQVERLKRHDAYIRIATAEQLKKKAEDALAEARKQRNLTIIAWRSLNSQKYVVEELLRKEKSQRLRTETALANEKTQKRRAESALAEARKAKEQVNEARSDSAQLRADPLDPFAQRNLSFLPSPRPEALQLDQRNRPVRLGSSVGGPYSERGAYVGSLCCVVQDRAGQRYYLLSPGRGLLSPHGRPAQPTGGR